MKNQLLFGAIATSVFSFGFGVLAQDSSAITIRSCSYTNPDYVNLDEISGESGTSCEYLDASFDNVSDGTSGGTDTLDVNGIDGDSFFDITTWKFFSTTGDGVKDGFWEAGGEGSLTYATNIYEKVMAVFKDGRNGYTFGILLDGSGSLSWEASPWNNNAEVSNVRLFGYNADPVPTPAAVLPILGGLFGAASRRKKGESTEA